MRVYFLEVRFLTELICDVCKMILDTVLIMLVIPCKCCCQPWLWCVEVRAAAGAGVRGGDCDLPPAERGGAAGRRQGGVHPGAGQPRHPVAQTLPQRQHTLPHLIDMSSVQTITSPKKSLRKTTIFIGDAEVCQIRHHILLLLVC